MVRAGRYYGEGKTNNEAESWALRDALDCLVALAPSNPALQHPVRIFGDSHLLIRFMTRVYRRPQRSTIYWAIDQARRSERRLFGPVAYRHVRRSANIVADDMARRALEKRGEVIYWSGALPPDAPANQLVEVYAE